MAECPTNTEVSRTVSWKNLMEGISVTPIEPETKDRDEILRVEREECIRNRNLLPLRGNGSTFIDPDKLTVIKFSLGETHVSASVDSVKKQAELIKKAVGQGGLPKYIGEAPAGGYEMEGIPGKSLEELEKEGKELTAEQKEELIQLLKELHATLGRAHGDLVNNEDNIRITPEGHVRLIDIFPLEPWISQEEELRQVENMLKFGLGEVVIPKETKIEIPDDVEQIGKGSGG